MPCGPINTVDEAFADPQIRFREMELHLKDAQGQDVPQVACPIKMSGTPPRYDAPPPKLGQHTDSVLSALGYDAAAIAQLKANGTV